MVEDCGELINPHVVEGQIRGGVAQGIGAVLYEQSAYDEDANFQAGTFMDYLHPDRDGDPRDRDPPRRDAVRHRGQLPGRRRGRDDRRPAAITNAIEDALAHLGVRITEQHLPPTRILELAGVIIPDA